MMQWLPIILAKNDTWISKFIRFFTKEHDWDYNDWSHVGVIDNGFVLESRGGVGCVATPLGEFIGRYSNYKFAYIPIVSKRKAYDFCWKHIKQGTKHDKSRAKGFIAQYFRLGTIKDFERTDELDCAEFVQGAAGWLGKIDNISPNFFAGISEERPPL